MAPDSPSYSDSKKKGFSLVLIDVTEVHRMLWEHRGETGNPDLGREVQERCPRRGPNFDGKLDL